MTNTQNNTRRALNVVVKHQSKTWKPSNKPNALTRNINLGSLVIAHPNLYRDPYHKPVLNRANSAFQGLPSMVAGYNVPIRIIDPSLLRRLHTNGSLSIALAEHEYWHPESDPRDIEYYLKHSRGYLIGIGPEEALTLPDLSEQQQTRIIKAALCGTQPFRPTGIDSRYTIMGETLVNLWNMTYHGYVVDVYHEEEIDDMRTRLLRAILKAYRQCHPPRSTVQTSTATVTQAKVEIDRLVAPLATNATRNRAAAGIRRVLASVARRSRLEVAAYALERAMQQFSIYLRKTYPYTDPFMSPYADIFKTILKST
jgi:hypothetical protein